MLKNKFFLIIMQSIENFGVFSNASSDVLSYIFRSCRYTAFFLSGNRKSVLLMQIMTIDIKFTVRL